MIMWLSAKGVGIKGGGVGVAVGGAGVAVSATACVPVIAGPTVRSGGLIGLVSTGAAWSQGRKPCRAGRLPLGLTVVVLVTAGAVGAGPAAARSTRTIT